MNVKGAPQEMITACPDCGHRIVLKNKIVLGQRWVCIHCGTELKVVEISPLKLRGAFSV